MNGWIKLYRKIMENPIVAKDADHLATWVYLLLNATHESYPVLFKGKKVVLMPGQLITGCSSISSRLGINESKVRRVLKAFENDGQIGRQISNQNSLISIVNWDFYQGSDGQNDVLLTDERRTGDGQMTDGWQTGDRQMTGERRTSDGKQEYKNIKNDKNVKECKNVRSSKGETSRQIFDRLIGNYAISKSLVDKMGEWITYKAEQKFAYKEQGLKALLRRVESEEQKHGSLAVINLVDECMGNGWKGIIWDRLKSEQSSSNSKKSYVDMWRDV